MDFLEVAADLHLHGLYSGGVSEKMLPRVLAEQAKLKGIGLLGTGDILNARWIRHVKDQLKPADGGIYRHENGTSFVLQTEVEDINRVHQLILFPDMSKVEELRERFSKVCKDLDTDGRPKIRLSGEELAEACKEAGCLLGFSHAFTPYFGIYAKFSSYKDCYGKFWKTVSFGELGLSADTNMADRISELHGVTFLSNSDAHSPWPNKMGREFNILKLGGISFEEVGKALKREAGRGSVLNVGLNPLEGKYHKTRCRGCLMFYEPKDAERLGWRCGCGNTIKKGVDCRVEELADLPGGGHPPNRPKYVHIIPLSEIIALALGIESPFSEKVQATWHDFVKAFGTEIEALLKADLGSLSKVNSKVAEYIGHFRGERIRYVPGGAGVYGKLLRPGEKEDVKMFEGKQKSLSDF